MKRITRFLLNPELEESVVGRVDADLTPDLPPVAPCSPTKEAISAVTSARSPAMLDGSFFWEPPEIPAPAKGKGKGKGKGGRGGGGGRGSGRSLRANPGAAPARGSTRRLFGRRNPTPIDQTAPQSEATAVAEESIAHHLADERAAEKAAAAGDEASGSPARGSKPVGGAGKGAAAGEAAAPKAGGAANPTLKELALHFPPGQLTMIAGAVGSGKSSLLSALLGELRSVGGAKAGVSGRVGYVAQTAFVLNETLRENILFGRPMDEDRYEAVLEACTLLPDLKILPGGDMTQIGEKGVNLSGGQKARIALARACYAQADVLLLDDPLSAVDAHVGKHLFRHVLGPRGLLAGTTRILVTHQTQFLPLCDLVVIMDGGRVACSGSYAELKAQSGFDGLKKSGSGADLASLGALSELAESDLDDRSISRSTSKTPSRVASSAALSALAEGGGDGGGGEGLKAASALAGVPMAPGKPAAAAGAKPSDRSISLVEITVDARSTAEGATVPRHHVMQVRAGTIADMSVAKKGKLVRSGTQMQVGDSKKNAVGSKMVEAEERKTGAVGFGVYAAYMRAAGGYPWFLLLLLACCTEKALLLSTDYWLPIWIDASNPGPTSGRSAVIPSFGVDPQALEFWVPIYFGLASVGMLAVYCRSVLMQAVMGVRACRTIYAALIRSVLAAPMTFFETTPSGRILNRFTSDTEQLDMVLLMTATQWVNCIFNILGTLVLVSVTNYYFLAWLFPLFLLYTLLFRHTNSATRDLQRLEAVSRSPIFAQFSETLNGISTIRAFGRVRDFQTASQTLVNTNSRCFFSQILAQQWVSIRLDLIGSTVIAAAVLLPVVAVNFNQDLSIALAGLAISYTLEICNFLKHMTKITLDLEKSFASVERMHEYATAIAQEPTTGEPAPPAPWPTVGAIEMTKLCVRYRPELPFALVDVSCTIAPKSKVGVVGRTGSGKSTFVSALWRLVEPSGGVDGAGGGAIRIDGVDISTLQVLELRSRLAIIPQDPVLFTNTLRYNLDPFALCTDAELRRVLKLVQLEDLVGELEGGLEYKVSENGANFSVGQRQLLCLARATLRHSAVLVLDEATASIDNETDAVLQRAIREMFIDCTVLTIAHRLHTIMDSTQVMLFDAGRLAEFDAPESLLAEPESMFSQLVDNTGPAAEGLRALAAEAAGARPEAASVA